MVTVVRLMLQTLRASFRTRAALQLELIALRHQLSVFERTRPQRVALTRADRQLWVSLSRVWPAWRAALVRVQPDTRHRHQPATTANLR